MTASAVTIPFLFVCRDIPPMPTLFDPIRVGRMALSNRVAMAPLTRNRSPGAVPPKPAWA